MTPRTAIESGLSFSEVTYFQNVAFLAETRRRFTEKGPAENP
jgi:hypothetical protein